MAMVVQRRVPFEGIQNLRDLGGYQTAGGGQVRWGRIYRADALHKLTRDDIDKFGRLGVRTVYDLRNDLERAEFPGPFDSVQLSIVGRPEGDKPQPLDPDMTQADGERMLRDLYVGALTHSAARFGALFAGLAEPTRLPAVFHCHGGKDRTGVVAALLLLALGVDREAVLDDYEATGLYRTIVHQQDSLAKMLARGVAPEAAAGALGVPRWAMADAIDAIEGDYGGIDAYLTQQARLSSAALQRLRLVLVEPVSST